MRVAPDIIGDISMTRGLIVIAIKIRVEQVDLLFVQIIKSVFKYHKYRFVFCLFYYALEIFFAIKEDNALIPITSISKITAVA